MHTNELQDADEAREVLPPIDEPVSTESSESASTIDEAKPPKKSHKKLIIFIILGILIIAGLTTAGLWFFLKPAPVAQTETKKEEVTKPIPEADALTRFTTPTTGETWLPAPVPIASLGYIQINDGEEDAKYYEVGKRGDNTIIMTVQYFIGASVELFEKGPNGEATAIARPNANLDYTMKENDYSDDNKSSGHWSYNVDVSKTIHYDSLSIPTSLDLNDKEKLIPSIYNSLGDLTNTDSDTTTRTVVKTYGGSTLIKLERKYVDTKLTAVNYALELPTGTTMYLNYSPITEKVDDYTWTDGIKRTGSISGVIRGCGAVGSSVSRLDGATDADFVSIGKTADGQTVYGFKNSTHPLLKVDYDEYVQSLSYQKDVTALTFEQWMTDHAMITYKNNAGEWLIYSQDKYALVGGCGKPVVYLYPTKTTSVNVSVGANVTVSEPFYNPSTGWKNVIAQPNGQLSYQGKSYDSLFWEGTGFGPYPAITSGTVVTRSQAESTIRAQLKAQGLNTKETNDFMDFWASRIPNTAYVRLTWFSTKALNSLAPLAISPAPQTTIRVFLDMRGLDQPISMPAQHFTAPARNGFTVVEWGGLLSGIK
ncbi:MAG: hypothetical protein JWM52_784 [Candidatus Saccharibacteria bacterium]|nr:hypothetical protein [Candidatus Saccharibacteria bacterium]